MLNLFCKVVDTTLGVKAVRGFVRAFGVSQTSLVAAREPGDDADYELTWASHQRIKEFRLM